MSDILSIGTSTPTTLSTKESFNYPLNIETKRPVVDLWLGWVWLLLISLRLSGSLARLTNTGIAGWTGFLRFYAKHNEQLSQLSW